MSTHVNFVAFMPTRSGDPKKHLDVFIVRGVEQSGDYRTVFWDQVAHCVDADTAFAIARALPHLEGCANASFYAYENAARKEQIDFSPRSIIGDKS